MRTIKITKEHRGRNSTTFTGRLQGLEVRNDLKLSEEDKNKDIVNVLIPKDTTSFNPSFYLGLFFDSICSLGGIDLFKEKYKIKYEDTDPEIIESLQENIEDCERQASNEYKRKNGLKHG